MLPTAGKGQGFDLNPSFEKGFYAIVVVDSVKNYNFGTESEPVKANALGIVYGYSKDDEDEAKAALKTKIDSEETAYVSYIGGNSLARGIGILKAAEQKKAIEKQTQYLLKMKLEEATARDKSTYMRKVWNLIKE